MLNLTQEQKAWAFDTIFTNSPIGMALLDRDGIFSAINLAWCATLEVTPAEILGKRFQDITTSETIRLDEQNAKLVLDGLMDAYTLPKAYRLKDGSIIKKVRLTVGRIPPPDAGDMLYFVAMILSDEDKLLDIPANITRIESLPSMGKSFAEIADSISKNAKWIGIIVAIIGGVAVYIIKAIKGL